MQNEIGLDPELFAYQRSLCTIVDNHVKVDLDKLDLSRQLDQSLIPDFTPKATLRSYNQVRRVMFDIETTGLDPLDHQIKSIGIIYNDTSDIKNARSIYIIEGQDTQGLSKLSNVNFVEGECELLELFFNVLEKLRTNSYAILGHYNGFIFDMPFIQKRCELLGVASQFWVNPYCTADATAQHWGKPITDPRYLGTDTVGYHSYYLRGYEVVDVYHKVLSLDFVKRKLTGYSLKNVVYELDLVNETRVELTYDELLATYGLMMEDGELVSNGKPADWRTHLEYLKADLEHTLILADFLIPSYYYQQELLPWWRLQSIFTRGNGSKWNEIITSEYYSSLLTYEIQSKSDNSRLRILLDDIANSDDVIKGGIKPDTPKRFEGGLTSGIAGLFFNVGKLDVASLYPSIILSYGIHSRKDIKATLLSILKYAKNKRIALKAIKDIDPNADLMQGSLKVFINSASGGLGTAGVAFNDYEAAALVTAYGRKILLVMQDAIHSIPGTKCIELDTDGIYFAYDGDHDVVLKAAQDAMPSGIILENEMLAKAVYIPAVTVPANFESGSKPEDEPGLRKNYIIVEDVDKFPKVSGKFRNRSFPTIYKKFVPEMIWKLAKTHERIKDAHDEDSETWNTLMYRCIINHYLEVKVALTKGTYPEEDMMITRKAKANEKAVFHNNCVTVTPSGIPVAKYFIAQVRGKRQKWTKQTTVYPCISTDREAIIEAYIRKITEFTNSVSVYVTGRKIGQL